MFHYKTSQQTQILTGKNQYLKLINSSIRSMPYHKKRLILLRRKLNSWNKLYLLDLIMLYSIKDVLQAL